MPACNFVVQGSTLFIVGPTTLKGDGQAITITDAGGTDADSVSATCVPATAPMSAGATSAPPQNFTFFPHAPITRVDVLTGKGGDSVIYNLTHDLVASRSVVVNLGDGRNSFAADVTGGLSTGSSLSLTVRGGSGPDQLKATLMGSLQPMARLALSFHGGPGKNNVSVQTTGSPQVGTAAVLTEVLDGGGGTDTISSLFQGKLDGLYQILERGGSGRNTMLADIGLDAASTGGRLLPSSLIGGPGNDTLTFDVQNSSDLPADNESVNGGAGSDTCSRTSNVLALNCEHDNLISNNAQLASLPAAPAAHPRHGGRSRKA